MGYDVLRDAEKYTRVHKRKRFRHRVVTALASAVVFCTTYALILPAITLEKQCDIPEHTHTDACYAQVTSVEKRVLVCGEQTPEIHRHTADCYALPEETGQDVHTHTDSCYALTRGNLVCGEHVHTDACYTETAVLVCGLEESEEHQHDQSCYETSRELTCGVDSDHTHTDDCYEWDRVLSCDLPTDPAKDAQPVLVCEKPEIVLHSHTSDCFDADGNLICGQDQVLEHQHSDACFETVTEPVDTGTLTCTDTSPEHQHTALCYGTWELVCGQEEHTHSPACTPNEQEEAVFCGKDAHTHGEACRDENGELTCTLEEHTHTLACYADPGADLETAEIWEQTFAGVTLTGNWRQDALAIAETQLGYAESTKNYLVAQDGETVKGYTRYGAWCEEPYGDWNVMFLSFCLHYAGVEGVPPDRDCGGWVTAWADAFEPAQSHTPAVGDLVLFDRDGDGTADRAGLVARLTDSGFDAIEGDAEDAVGLMTYGAEDTGILGYISLLQGPKEFTLTAQSESGITVTVTGPRESLPCAAQEITLAVTEKVDEESRAVRNALLGEEEAEPERSFLLDITLHRGEEEIEPVGPVTVTFSGLNTQGLYPKVYHIDTDTQTVRDMEAEKTETGDVAVDTDHFSWYDISLVAARDLTGPILADTFQAGGEFTLTGDVQTAERISQVAITKDTTIDLNGHTLTIKANQCFVVESGTLTIQDSQAPAEETVDLGGSNPYGNTASLTDDTLTYYITKSTPTGTGTTETLIKHEVPLTDAGKILCKEGSNQAIKVETGGTLELRSGVLQGTRVKHIVYVEDGTLNMTGGYIVGGGSDDQPGGGIFVTGGAEKGTVNIQGGVVAANRGNFGGGIYVENGTLNISGGAVTGNEVFNGHEDNGGGIYVSSGTLNLSGNGYVTNNSKDCTCAECQGDKNNTHGGGGIALANGTTMNMSGGYVTGNYSTLAGGGIYAGFFEGDGGVNFSMTGGTIASNCARYGEGGGLRIGGGTNGVIRADEKVYITNNQTLTTDDWGGGGIFVQQNGLLTVADALITDNTAGGFGGGVGACPTGETLIVNKDGAAIYDNTASGKQMSGGGNNKTYDTDLAQNSSDFMKYGYRDYFCVRAKEGANNYISLVTGLMAGGGAANWTGSCDEKPVTIGRTGYAAAKYLFGLVANPEKSDKDRAVAAARVMITGNSSGVHGGGIMTNGGLILGDPKGSVVTATPELDITGTKVLRKDGVRQEGLAGFQFQFQLKNSTGTFDKTVGADDTTGVFTFQDIDFSEAGTYTYYLTEVNDGRNGVSYDSSTYQIVVTVQSKTETLAGVTFTRLYVGGVTVTKTGGDTPDSGETVSNNNTFKIHFNNGDNWSKVCLYTWDCGEITSTKGSWPGMQVNEDPNNPGWYTKEFTVNGKGTVNYIFNNGDEGKQTGNLSGSYQPGGDLWVYWDGTSATPTTAAPKSWNSSSSGSNVSFTGTPDSEGSYTLTINGAAFTNTMTTQVNLQITKTDSVDNTNRLEGAIFTLTKAGTENPEDSLTGTTDENGIATFTGIRRNTTYYLHETQAPSGYMTAGPWILEVKESTATLYPATEGEKGVLTITSETGTVLEGSDSDPIVFSATISDQSWGYKLPDTGGAGTTSYTTGGLVLIFGAATLMYVQCKRRKEDEVSS